MVMKMYISLIRTVILYALIVCVLRLMGKRQIGELEPAELVATILISDLAAVPMQDIGIPLLSGVIPILTLLAMELIIAEVSMRSIRFRKLLCGKPVFLIRDGIIDQKAMAKNRFSLDELRESLREKGILDVSKVKYAVLETNGKLSTFLFPAFNPPTSNDLHIKTGEFSFPVAVISDGVILSDNLLYLGLDSKWLHQVLNGSNPKNVFLMTVTEAGAVVIVPKERKA